MDAIIRTAGFVDLDTPTLYALLRLRCEVFVREQECAYLDLDGRDADPGTRHLWIDHADEPVAYLRILDSAPTVNGPAARIGRVCTARTARGRGLAGQLMEAALAWIGPRPCELAAQSHLTGFYARYGFTATGPDYLDDGIPHTPMRRAG